MPRPFDRTWARGRRSWCPFASSPWLGTLLHVYLSSGREEITCGQHFRCSSRPRTLRWPRHRARARRGRSGPPLPPPRAAALERATRTPHATRRLVVALSLTMVIFAVELVGFWSGLTMFAVGQSFMHIVLHLAGSICVCIFILDGAHYQLYWIFFAVFSALPGLVELVSIALVLSRKQW